MGTAGNGDVAPARSSASAARSACASAHGWSYCGRAISLNPPQVTSLQGRPASASGIIALLRLSTVAGPGLVCHTAAEVTPSQTRCPQETPSSSVIVAGAVIRESGPFHADGRQRSMAVTERSGQTPPQRRRNLPWSDRTVESRTGRCTAELGPYMDQERRRYEVPSQGRDHSADHDVGGVRYLLTLAAVHCQDTKVRSPTRISLITKRLRS